MDFWSRLIGGTGSYPTKSRPTNTPSERLAAFKRTCNALQHIWRTSTLLASNGATLNYCRNCLQRLNSLLDEESRTTAPYSCLLYAASTQIYIIVTKLALSSEDSGIIGASAQFFHFLIDGEVESLLDNKLFARSLIDLVKRKSGTKLIVLGEQGEGNLVELLFGIATKIRLDPEILPAWFYPAHNQEAAEGACTKGPEFAGATRRADFPLFYELVDHVYHDGRIGDFARTGLLYLTDTASKSKELEKWMIESDLATLMASGLGALYSRLSRSLPSPASKGELPPILALSDYISDAGGTASSIETFRQDMGAFLSYLLFWQDTLHHCQSVEVKDTLLDHFQVLFLQQLLYPSLLESSDIEGGTAASVMMYLYRILDSLDHPDLVGRILMYLLASKNPAMDRSKARKQRMSLSRRKSLDALTALAQARDHPSPDLFSLLDLVLMSLKSKHSQTIAASLKLIAVVQQRHHRFVGSSLVRARAEDVRLPLRKLPDLNDHLRRLIDLAPVILDDGFIDQSYGAALKDVMGSLETHSCSAHACQEATSPTDQEQKVVIVEDDFVVAQIRMLLASFFANDAMINLALTEAVICMASCRLTSLDGWLLPPPSSTTRVTSTIISILEGLVGQVRQWKHQMPGWDNLLALQKSYVNEQNVGDAEVGSTSPRSQPSTDSDRPPSILGTGRRSAEVSSQTSTYRGRGPRRALHPETFGSLNGSLASSPSPANVPHKPSQLTTPLRQQSLLQTPSNHSPASRTTSRSSTCNPPDPLQCRLVLPPHPLTSVYMAKYASPVDPVRRDSDSAASGETPSANPTGMETPSERQSWKKKNNDGGGGGGDGDDDVSTTTAATTVTLGHVLINAIILQEFILEVAALVQLRACLWGEVQV